MAAIGTTLPTLHDQVKRRDPNGAIATIIESLTQRNAFLQDSVWTEGNLPTGHRYTNRTALPSISWRKMNEGILASKSQTNQADETCGQLEGLSKIDCKLADLYGNAGAFRLTENQGFMQAMQNEIETGCFYHSTKSAPEKFMGLSPRLDATTNTGGSQILKHDPSPSGSDQTSMWLVGWGTDTVHMIYPKGSNGGLESHDMGQQLVDDGTGAGKVFRAWVSNWNWQVGLAVEDWRYLVRICNIDVSQLSATGSALIQSMIKAVHMIQDRMKVRLVFYCNRTIGTYLHLQALDSVKNSTLSIQNVGGQFITTFLGIPIRESDALLNTESIIS